MEYVEWIENEENGFKISKSNADITLQLAYLTPEYFCIKQMNNLEQADSTYFNNLLKAKKNFEYVRLSVNKGFFTNLNGSPMLQFELDRWISQQLRLVDDSCGVSPLVFVYAEESNVKKKIDTYLIGYNKCSGSNTGCTVILDVNTLGIDKLQLRISKEKFSEIPRIKFS